MQILAGCRLLLQHLKELMFSWGRTTFPGFKLARLGLDKRLTNWTAVKELNLSYHNPETVLLLDIHIMVSGI